MKNKILIFTAGVIAGGILSLGFLKIMEKETPEFTSSASITEEINDHSEDNLEKQNRIEYFQPTFSSKRCRQQSNYVSYLMQAGYRNTTSDITMASGLISLLNEIELYIFMNEKARSLGGKEQQNFIAAHRAWQEWWKKEIKEPARDPDGEIIEGSMAVSIQAGNPGDLIEEYLNKFPDRTHVEYDYIAEHEKESRSVK